MRSSSSGSERSPFAVYLDDPVKIGLMKEQYAQFLRGHDYGEINRLLNGFPMDEEYEGIAELTVQLLDMKDVIEMALRKAGPKLNNDKTASRLAREAVYASKFMHWLDELMINAINNNLDDTGRIREDVRNVLKKVVGDNDALLEEEKFKRNLLSSYLTNIFGGSQVATKAFGSDEAIDGNPHTNLYLVFSGCVNQCSINLDKTRYDLFAGAFNRLIQYPVTDSRDQIQTKQQYIALIRQTRQEMKPELLTVEEAKEKYAMLAGMCEQYVSGLEALKRKEAKKSSPKITAHMSLESEHVHVEAHKDKHDEEPGVKKLTLLVEAARTNEIQGAVNNILGAIKNLYDIKRGPGVISEAALAEIQAVLANAYGVIDETIRRYTEQKLVGADDLRDVIVEAIRQSWFGQYNDLFLQKDFIEKMFEIINKQPNAFTLLPDHDKYYHLAMHENDLHKKAEYEALNEAEKQKFQMAMLALMEFTSDVNHVRGEHFWRLCQNKEINPENMTLNDAELTLQCVMNFIQDQYILAHGKNTKRHLEDHDYVQAQEMLSRVWGMRQEGFSENVIKYMLLNEALKIAHKGDESVLLPLPSEDNVLAAVDVDANDANNEAGDNERSAMLLESVSKLETACVDYKRHLLKVIEPILAREYPDLHQRYVSISQQSGKKLFNQDLFASEDFKKSNIRQHAVLAAVMEKYDVVNALHLTLRTDEAPLTRLRHFGETLHGSRGILDRHRSNDGALVKFLKNVGRVLATVFTAGAAYSRLWKSTGERAAEKMEHLLPTDAKTQSSAKRKK